MSTLTNEQIVHWHRRICWITPWLAVSGDLDTTDAHRCVNQIIAWENAGITDILDVRYERNDEPVIKQVNSPMNYWHVPTDDAGNGQSHEWFVDGIAAMTGVFNTAHSWLGVRASDGWSPGEASPTRRVMVHCHMGVNRGPSMAYRLLLAAGWGVIEGLDAIREARPIANIEYAHDALVDHLATVGVSETEAYRLRKQVKQWHKDNPVNVSQIIRAINRYAA